PCRIPGELFTRLRLPVVSTALGRRQRCRGIHVRQTVRATETLRRDQPKQDVGRGPWRFGVLDGVGLAALVQFSALRVGAAPSGRPDRWHRGPARRSHTQHDQARRWREGHGLADPWTRRSARSSGQPDLRGSTVLSYGAMVLRHLLNSGLSSRIWLFGG